MKNCLIGFICSIFCFCLGGCCSAKPVATTHTERIEEKMMPIPVGADTIEIVLSHTDDLSHTDLTDLTENLSPTDDTDCSDYNSSFSSIRSLTSSKIARRIDTDFNAGAATASSVLSVGSVRNKNSSVREKENSVRISSTRGVNISRHETDTTSTLRITLRPDTVFVPYTHHIRSDTIVVPDRICETKLQKTQTANVLLILILIVIFIILLKNRMTRK